VCLCVYVCGWGVYICGG